MNKAAALTRRAAHQDLFGISLLFFLLSLNLAAAIHAAMEASSMMANSRPDIIITFSVAYRCVPGNKSEILRNFVVPIIGYFGDYGEQPYG